MNINEVSDRLTRKIMVIREKHRQKLKENQNNKFLRDLHQDAFKLYGKAETILKMHGDSGLTAAKEYVREAQNLEKKVVLFTEAPSKKDISLAVKTGAYHDYYGNIHANQRHKSQAEKDSNKQCALWHWQARNLYNKSVVSESLNEIKKADDASERADNLTDFHINKFGKLNLNVKQTERK